LPNKPRAVFAVFGTTCRKWPRPIYAPSLLISFTILRRRSKDIISWLWDMAALINVAFI
jgi:hypothetical protein